MTPAPHERAFDLAVEFQRVSLGQDGATIMFAGCWLLAALARQAEHERGQAIEDTITLITEQLRTYVAHMRTVSGGGHAAVH